MFIFQTSQLLCDRGWPITLKQICAIETPRKVIATEVISPIIARILSYENKILAVVGGGGGIISRCATLAVTSCCCSVYKYQKNA